MRALVLLVSLISVAAADWPQWRGPMRNGHASSGERGLSSLPVEPPVRWKVKAGPGLASPVVQGDTVVIFDAWEGKECVRALERATGEEKWRVAIDETFHDSQGPDGPRCTPMINDGRVYAVSCRGRLECLTLADGAKVWSSSFERDFGAVFVGEKGSAPGASRHGNNGTPLISGDRLFVLVGSTNAAGVVCFDKRNGKVLWKSQNAQAAYAPPVLLNLAGRSHLVCFMADDLIGLDPENGELWWRFPIKTSFARHVTAPVAHGDIVVVSSHQAGLIGTRVSKTADGFKAEEAWTSRNSAINFSSPVQIGAHLYGLGPRKNLMCVSIPTGEELWSEEGHFQSSADKAYAGFIVLGSNILVLTDGGSLVLFEANPNGFKELGNAQACGVNWCNPAYSDGMLFVRDGIKGSGELICLNLSAD